MNKVIIELSWLDLIAAAVVILFMLGVIVSWILRPVHVPVNMKPQVCEFTFCNISVSQLE